MKILKIERGNGCYLSGLEEYTEIDKITKDHLIVLINATLEHEVTFDAYDEHSLHNQAQRIVYRNVLEKLQDLASRRQEFKDESDKWFEKEYERYAQPVAE